jgi:hypothetical protein
LKMLAKITLRMCPISPDASLRVTPVLLPGRQFGKLLEFHLDGLREDGTPIPPPSSHVDYVEVAA